jgi:hypothetical protein
LEKGERTETVKCYSVTWLDESPFASFVFKSHTKGKYLRIYRIYLVIDRITIADLQAMCVIPRTPSPPPVSERPLDSLSRDELVALLEQERVSGFHFSITGLHARRRADILFEGAQRRKERTRRCCEA